MSLAKIEKWISSVSFDNLWCGRVDMTSVSHGQSAHDPGLNCREFAMYGERNRELGITGRFTGVMGQANQGVVVSHAVQQGAAGAVLEVLSLESGIPTAGAARMAPDTKPAAGWYPATGGWVNGDHVPSCDAWDHAWLEYWNADGSRVIFESFTRQIIPNTQTREEQQLSIWIVPAGTPNRLHHSKQQDEGSTIAVAARVRYKPRKETVRLICEGLDKA